MNENIDSNIAGNKDSDMEDASKIGVKYTDTDLFPADRLISKMGDNMARAEAMNNDTPLWTEKTAEIEDGE